jgi:hypothetical protein
MTKIKGARYTATERRMVIHTLPRHLLLTIAAKVKTVMHTGDVMQ